MNAKKINLDPLTRLDYLLKYLDALGKHNPNGLQADKVKKEIEIYLGLRESE